VNVPRQRNRGGNHKWGFPLHLHVLPYNTFCARAHTHLRKFGYNSNDGAQRALISLERGNRIVGVKEATARRFAQICAERNICINNLANISGVSASTAYSMMRKDRHDISLLTVKKFCDGLGMTLGEFFSTPEFDNLEQEIY
jgi:DNA-binding Xre family transcriptional regulator